MNWRRLFPLVLLFSCIDGFIINFFYPSRLALLAKDIFILVVYLSFFLTKESGKNWVVDFSKSIGSSSWYLAISLILLGALQIFNPEVPGILVGILGFKIMFFYWPLAILAYAYTDNLDVLERLLKAIVYLSIPICLFGIFQFWQRPDFMVRVFGHGFERAVVITSGGSHRSESFLRVFGTFASSGQFTSFLIINAMFIFALLFTSRTKFIRVAMVGCLVLNYVTLLCTGSRSGFLLFFGVTFIFILLCRWLWKTFFIILLLSISFSFGFNYLGKGVIGRFNSVKDIAMLRSRTIETTTGMFKIYLEEHPFGRGLGTASGASRYLYKEQPTDIDLIENYPTKLQCEVGIVGVVLFYMLLLSLLIYWLLHWLKFIDRRHYVFIAALSAYCFSQFFSSLFGVLDSPPIAIFLWTEIGIVARLATFKPDDDQYSIST